MNQTIQESLTFDDVLLVPQHSTVLPAEVTVKTQLTPSICLNIPLLSAAMDTVTEARLAIAMAQLGGLGIIHKNMTLSDQAAQVRKVKKFESGIVTDPVTVTPNTTIAELLQLKREHHFSGMPVVDNDNLVGIITNRDVRFETHLDQPVSRLMTPKSRLVTVPKGANRERVIQLLHKHRIEKVLVVDNRFKLCGMITVKDMLTATMHPNACKDKRGQLLVGAAVGVSQDTQARVAALIQAGVDVIAVDTAHGHSKRVLSTVHWIKKQFPQTTVIGGNIATGEAALALAQAGADVVKVGIGPGSICTTRVVTGVGVPQITAIQQVAQAVQSHPISVIADGGIRFSGDLSKAIAAGASAAMIGSLFAGTEEAPGELVLYQGRSYKKYWGMGSVKAMAHAQGSSDRYFQDATKGTDKLVPEGIEGRVPYKGQLAAVVHQMMGGLRSTMGYTGCASIEALRTQARFTRITAAGMRESHVHDVIITKEAPNYWVDE